MSSSVGDEGLMRLVKAVVCLLAAPRVKLSVSAPALDGRIAFYLFTF